MQGNCALLACLLCRLTPLAQHVCVFSAVACECNHSRVACIRHWRMLCKCVSKDKKFLLG